jgi:hypothetical protein
MVPTEILPEQYPCASPKRWTSCPHVRTLQGTHPNYPGVTLLPIRCKRWSCPHCRIVNAIKLKEKAIAGKPTRLITFTLRPEPGELFWQMYLRGKPAIPRVWQRLRSPDFPVEAMTFVEMHRSGKPHWHCLVRSGFIGQHKLSELWKTLTGSFVVDIRKIKQPHLAAGYVTKYVTKQLAMLRRLGVIRVWSMTHRYLIEHKTIPHELGWSWTYDRRHPDEIAERAYRGWKAEETPEGTIHLTWDSSCTSEQK